VGVDEMVDAEIRAALAAESAFSCAVIAADTAGAEVLLWGAAVAGVDALLAATAAVLAMRAAKFFAPLPKPRFLPPLPKSGTGDLAVLPSGTAVFVVAFGTEKSSFFAVAASSWVSLLEGF
jgi:hypothetical protein